MNDQSTDETPVDVGLNLTDIELMILIIDHAVDNGSFRGWDMLEKVRATRIRLGNFIEAARAHQKAQRDAQSQETGE